MLRALAGVWYELRTNHDWDPTWLLAWYAQLAPQMSTPLPAENPWFKAGLEAMFYKNANGYSSPAAHRGAVRGLQQILLQWALAWGPRPACEGRCRMAA